MKRTTFVAAVVCLLGTGLSCTHEDPNNSGTGTSQRVEEWQDSTLSGNAVIGFSVGSVGGISVQRQTAARGDTATTRSATSFDGQTYTLAVDDRITIAMQRGTAAEVIKIYKVTNAGTGALTYDQDADGNVTEPFSWKSKNETVKLRAWSYGNATPYTDDPLTTRFTLNQTQTELTEGQDNYCELLYDKQRDYPYATSIALNLYHQLARITVQLTHSADNTLTIASNGVTIGGGVLPTSALFVAPEGSSNIGSWEDLQTNTGTVIARKDMDQKYSAVLFPKTYSEGTKIVGVTTTAASPFNSYAYILPSGGEELEAGMQYSYTVNVRDLVLVSGLTVGDIAAVTYNGSAQTPEPTVTDPESGKVLTKDTHYTLSYTNNTNAGTATCTVTGLGIYSGTKTKNFTINKKDLTNTSDFCYATNAITKDYVWEIGTMTTNPLTNTKGCTVTYSSSATGVATVNSSTGALTPGGTLNTNTTITATVTGSANYTGTATYTIKATSNEKSFSCTRTMQSEKLCKGTYTLQCWGASGGGGTDQSKGSHRGLGGYSYGNYTITSSTATLFVFVGGEGQSSTNGGNVDGGWNGGGNTIGYGGGSGGGMTHISTTNNPSTPLIDASATWNTTGTLIVAGGGGGTDDFDGGNVGDANDGSGGYGGGTSGGEPRLNGVYASGKAGTQTSGYKQGMGMSVPDTAWDDGGGGGGWWGGYWGGTKYWSGGGGGSGYIGGVSTPKETIAGNSSFPAPGGGNETGHGGDGYARITWVSN